MTQLDDDIETLRDVQSFVVGSRRASAIARVIDILTPFRALPERDLDFILDCFVTEADTCAHHASFLDTKCRRYESLMARSGRFYSIVEALKTVRS